MRKSIILIAATLVTVACGPKNKDKLGDNDLATVTPGEAQDPDLRCNAQVVQDEVKRQLFARAADIRGSNRDNYERIAGFAILQLDGAAPLAPVPATEQIDCRGHATLRLPAGLKAVGGRIALGGDVGYTIAPGRGGAVMLGQSDAIVTPLATLTQNRADGPVAAPASGSADSVGSSSSLPPPSQPAPAPRPIPTPAPRPRAIPAPSGGGVARPSYDCRRARTPSERAVCADSSLSALDRRMAGRYVNAIAAADPEQNQLLHTTRDRFLGYRERCRSDNACIANVYRGRLREIDDIMTGRWRGGQ